MNTSILQDWVVELPLRQQSILLGTIRGCDTDTSYSQQPKLIIKSIRNAILKPSSQTMWSDNRTPFFRNCDLPRHLQMEYDWFDLLPHHFVMHLVESVKMLAFKCPDNSSWSQHYLQMCKALKLHPETEQEMDERLKDDQPKDCSFGLYDKQHSVMVQTQEL